MADQIELTEPQIEDPDDVPLEPAPPITDRFLFVDVAAMRAKQLRRGALPRLAQSEGHIPVKAERVAMEEVKRGLVHYDLPPLRGRNAPPAGA